MLLQYKFVLILLKIFCFQVTKINYVQFLALFKLKRRTVRYMCWEKCRQSNLCLRSHHLCLHYEILVMWVFVTYGCEHWTQNCALADSYGLHAGVRKWTLSTPALHFGTSMYRSRARTHTTTFTHSLMISYNFNSSCNWFLSTRFPLISFP